MIRSIAFSALTLGLAVAAGAAVNTRIVLDEERMAQVEEGRIIASPIAGIQNHYWFDYRGNVLETRKELASDLRHASDTEDLRDAWDEYRIELADQRGHYIKQMAKRGYCYRSVEVID